MASVSQESGIDFALQYISGGPSEMKWGRRATFLEGGKMLLYCLCRFRIPIMHEQAGSNVAP
jgi:hypothetical protein